MLSINRNISMRKGLNYSYTVNFGNYYQSVRSAVVSNDHKLDYRIAK